MAAVSISLFAVLAAARAMAASGNGTGVKCYDFKLAVPVTATNYVLDIIPVNSNTDVVNFALHIDRWPSPNATDRILDTVTISNTYTLQAKLCTPDAANDKRALQLLTHGLLVDSRYWAVEIDAAEYSYVQAAAEAGYTVLSYDRIGYGLSPIEDAYQVIQGPLEVEILRVITEMARNGTIASSTLPVHVEAFDTVIHVGHSDGSELTAALLVAYPDLSSAAILTGFVFTSHTTPVSTASLGFEYAATNNPAYFGDRSSGYMVPVTVSNLQTAFYHRDNATDPAGYTNDLLAYGYSIKQPLTVAEWLSLRGLLTLVPAPAYKGPLQFFVGEYDFLLCGGDCKGDYDPAALNAAYPSASDIDVYVQPGAGYALTVHRNASAEYAVMQDWLASHGL
ncbi:hypothetical protein LTR53_010236 [Teratosphaeriaceae sp. CCFEE 6253]|nr:hypothetical protein LTR53_010236 [Teratosphaeriaceae sp. CCFEE 6253]